MYATAIYLGAADDARRFDARAAALAWFAGGDAGRFLFGAAVLRGRVALAQGAPRRDGRAGGTWRSPPCTPPASSRRCAAAGEVYFDSVSMFVFFLLAGPLSRNARAPSRARSHRCAGPADAAIRGAADRGRNASNASGSTSCASGDCVRVAEGGIVPADGVLLTERCRVDEALLSGESAPVTKRRDDLLIAGSVLEDGPVLLRIERVGADTTLAGIAALVGRAHAERPRLQVAGERAAAPLRRARAGTDRDDRRRAGSSSILRARSPPRWRCW